MAYDLIQRVGITAHASISCLSFIICTTASSKNENSHLGIGDRRFKMVEDHLVSLTKKIFFGKQRIPGG